MLAVVACLACLIAIGRTALDVFGASPPLIAAALAGPVLGGSVQMARGRGAVEGSIAGGVLCYTGYGIFVFIAGLLLHIPGASNLRGLPMLLVSATLGGVVVGLFVGLMLESAAALVRRSITITKAFADRLRPER